MTTALARPAGLQLPPLDLDPRPAERAFVDGLVDDLEPETFLWITVRQPDGGAHVYYRWTGGGRELGDRIDLAALTAGLDCADGFHIANRHLTDIERGPVRIQAHPLRPIQADVATGVRAPESERAGLRRVIHYAALESGQQEIARNPVLPRWLGVGPKLLTAR
ncbi:hypothetical protein OG618_37020 (plasmid) [Kitasatospora sp. NBC_01246]|uniref:hypothetical protein n=1 Tax=Kitasatospora sp. NBC_01246 TaxID=2903570 RepID=UPI002E359284|nr:hypothetical protein [Kitasatospora sp. NBC_01246]